MSFVLPGLRVAHCGNHYIFYTLQTKTQALILAVLHERSDLLTRLKSRLSISGFRG
ncbi:MAG: type II toxin-antitoxin system RelE/ParE family toxin [Alphaproteobacteria bacterium]|nr:type II toxin-antitoxin system RelE/ParE family toxin [Alphaproteobacteria bacterium]